MHGGGGGGKSTRRESQVTKVRECNLQIRSRYNSTSFGNLCATSGNVVAQICIRGPDITATFRDKSQGRKISGIRATKEREEKSIFHGLFEFRGLPHASTWNQNLQTRSECERATAGEKNAIVRKGDTPLGKTIIYWTKRVEETKAMRIVYVIEIARHVSLFHFVS